MGTEVRCWIRTGLVIIADHRARRWPRIFGRRALANKVAHTIRRGQLRLGLHAYNDESDIEAVIGHARDALARL
jgi:selenocysteine lyase/cysteine desulfurase